MREKSRGHLDKLKNKAYLAGKGIGEKVFSDIVAVITSATLRPNEIKSKVALAMGRGFLACCKLYEESCLSSQKDILT